jgi:lipoic acid synthetase
MSQTPFPRLPSWLKRALPEGAAYHQTRHLLSELRLQTVCHHARCPNRGECYSQKTATFLLLGPVCTRGCRFCSVPKGQVIAPDPTEPERVAEAARRLGLRHVVLTMVTRDDLSDGGVEHLVRTIHAIRSLLPKATIELLISDLAGNWEALDHLLQAGPDVLNHNCETVPRLYPEVRSPKADYRRTLELLRRAHRSRPQMPLKTGLMLGLGETTEEVLETLSDLLEAGCTLLTLGQYLQPTSEQIPVARYVPPEEFDQLGGWARWLGFRQVASGPFVRSSFQAHQMLLACR